MRGDLEEICFDVDGTVCITNQNKELVVTPGFGKLTSYFEKNGVGYSVITNSEQWMQVNKLRGLGFNRLANTEKFYASADCAAVIADAKYIPGTMMLEGADIKAIDIETSQTEKPHIYMFDKLIKDIGVSPEKILYVGNDLVTDVIPAKKAGLKVWYIEGTDSPENTAIAKDVADYHSTRDNLSSGLMGLVSGEKF